MEQTQTFPWQAHFNLQREVTALKAQAAGTQALQRENLRLKQDIKELLEVDEQGFKNLEDDIRRLRQEKDTANAAAYTAQQAASQAHQQAATATHQAAVVQQQANVAVQQAQQQASQQAQQQAHTTIQQARQQAHAAVQHAQQQANAANQQAVAESQKAAEAQRRADSEVQLREAAQAAKAEADAELQKMKGATDSKLEMLSRLLEQEQQKATAAQQALRTHKDAAAAAEHKVTQLSEQLERSQKEARGGLKASDRHAAAAVAAGHDVSHLSRQVQELQRSLEDVKGRLREEQMEVKRVQERAVQEAQQAEEAAKKLTELRKEGVDKAAAQIKELKQEVDRMRQSQSLDKSGLALMVSQLEEEVSKRKKSEAEVTRMRNHLLGAVDEKDKKIEDYTKACQDAQVKLKDAQTKVKNADVKVRLAQQDTARVKQDLEAERKAQKRALDEVVLLQPAAEALASDRARLQSLTVEVEELRASNQKLHHDMLGWQSSYQAQQGELTRTRAALLRSEQLRAQPAPHTAAAAGGAGALRRHRSGSAAPGEEGAGTEARAAGAEGVPAPSAAAADAGGNGDGQLVAEPKAGDEAAEAVAGTEPAAAAAGAGGAGAGSSAPRTASPDGTRVTGAVTRAPYFSTGDMAPMPYGPAAAQAAAMQYHSPPSVPAYGSMSYHGTPYDMRAGYAQSGYGQGYGAAASSYPYYQQQGLFHPGQQAYPHPWPPAHPAHKGVEQQDPEENFNWKVQEPCVGLEGGEVGPDGPVGQLPGLPGPKPPPGNPPPLPGQVVLGPSPPEMPAGQPPGEPTALPQALTQADGQQASPGSVAAPSIGQELPVPSTATLAAQTAEQHVPAVPDHASPAPAATSQGPAQPQPVQSSQQLLQDQMQPKVEAPMQQMQQQQQQQPVGHGRQVPALPEATASTQDTDQQLPIMPEALPVGAPQESDQQAAALAATPLVGIVATAVIAAADQPPGSHAAQHPPEPAPITTATNALKTLDTTAPTAAALGALDPPHTLDTHEAQPGADSDMDVAPSDHDMASHTQTSVLPAAPAAAAAAPAVNPVSLQDLCCAPAELPAASGPVPGATDQAAAVAVAPVAATPATRTALTSPTIAAAQTPAPATTQPPLPPPTSDQDEDGDNWNAVGLLAQQLQPNPSNEPPPTTTTAANQWRSPLPLNLPSITRPATRNAVTSLPATQLPATQLPGAQAIELPSMSTITGPPATLPATLPPVSAGTQPPADQLPATQLPVTHLPADQLPATHLPTDQLPATQQPANQPPPKQMPATQIAPLLPTSCANNPASKPALLLPPSIPARKSPVPSRTVLLPGRLPAPGQPQKPPAIQPSSVTSGPVTSSSAPGAVYNPAAAATSGHGHGRAGRHQRRKPLKPQKRSSPFTQGGSPNPEEDYDDGGRDDAEDALWEYPTEDAPNEPRGTTTSPPPANQHKPLEGSPPQEHVPAPVNASQRYAGAPVRAAAAAVAEGASARAAYAAAARAAAAAARAAASGGGAAAADASDMTAASPGSTGSAARKRTADEAGFSAGGAAPPTIHPFGSGLAAGSVLPFSSFPRTSEGGGLPLGVWSQLDAVGQLSHSPQGDLPSPSARGAKA